jgi:hypothetical protein
VTVIYVEVKYRSFVCFGAAKHLAELANGPTMNERWQGQAICFALPANPVSLSLNT